MMRCWLCLAVFTWIAMPVVAEEASPAAIEFFEKSVRPVLVEHCIKCHGPEQQKGGLRVDARAAMMQGGDTGPSILPGEPDKSVLIEAIRYTPDGYQMPPTGKLSDAEIAALTEWVKQGAIWPGQVAGVMTAGKEFDLEERAKHWSFQPVTRPVPPATPLDSWSQTPIDRFIARKLTEQSLMPSTPADRAVLLRRVSYDLIGLPPTPDELAAFLADDHPDAWDRAIDRLLASPHYGERWGRHWLDLVRFAETSGHEFDYEIPFAWRYRDYIIRAFNDDLPYDQLIREHIAGDLLAPRYHTVTGMNEAVIATGFYWFGQGKHSPVDVRAEECDTVDNQLDVIGKTFQGLTIACARCHDHKFDPLLQKDYYALAGFLQSSRQTLTDVAPAELRVQLDVELEVLHEQQTPSWLQASAAAVEPMVRSLKSRLLSADPIDVAWRDSWAEAARKDRSHPFHLWVHWAHTDNIPHRIHDWQQLREREATARAASPPTQQLAAPYETVAADGTPLSPWITEGQAFQHPGELSWLPSNSPEKPLRGAVSPTTWAHSGRVTGKDHGVLRSPTFTITTPYIDYWMHRRSGDAHPPRPNKQGQVSLIVDGFQIIRNPLYGHLTFNVEQAEQPKWYRQDVARFIGSQAYIEIEDLDDGEIIVEKIEFNTQGPSPTAYNTLLTARVDAADISTTEQLADIYQAAFETALERMHREGPTGTGDDAAALAVLMDWLLKQAPNVDAETAKTLAPAFAAQNEIEARFPAAQWTMALTDGTAEDEHLLIRGNPKKRGDAVSREFLTALQPVTLTGRLGPENEQVGSGRLELAECLADPANPLTARVLVNRLWQHHFGRGLVPTPDDFGKMGQPPSHPELLDWLASEFEQSGWSIKHMHRLMLTSAVYQQSSQLQNAQAEEIDPRNIWLHRYSVQRLEAEPIRDALLQLSGRLDDRLYGPSVLPHLTPFMEGRGRPSSGPLDGNGRRSLYINVRRNFLSPMFLAFDFPTPFTTMGLRSSSNVPAQALTLMNNPLVVQQTAAWADRVMAATPTPTDRVRQLYREAMSREPSDEELSAALQFVESAGQDPQRYRDLAHVLVNVKEFVFIE
ncbi:DUF1553 domain-containing protein [bacterium]|nr:DUF1553 domain-containing protein [bacterium]